MISGTNPANALLAFKLKNKFSEESWEERGLNPSEPELSNKMSLLFNEVTDELMNLVHGDTSEKQFRAVFKTALKRFNKREYDTEEREFICDLFLELAGIVKVDINQELNIWLYGVLPNIMQKLSNLVNHKRIIETIEQPCSKCSVVLETYVAKKQEGIPDSSWLIVKCNNCNELNLLSLQPNIKELKFGNYQWIDILRKDQYSYEQGLIRLEQIKIFRQ